MKGPLALFGGAVLMTLAIGHLLRDSPGFMVHNPDGTTTGDITHYIYWTRLVTLDGIQAAYSGSWPETYAVYPPLNLYADQVVGTLYQAFQDPSFDPVRAQDSLVLREGIKSVAMTWHVLSGVAIALLVHRISTPLLGAVAGALYLLNPAMLYDVAHWGQPDGAHALFSVLAVGGLAAGQVSLAWTALALAALAKPQAWSLVPLLVAATLRLNGLTSVLRGLGMATATSLLVVLPFIVTGHVVELLSLPGTLSSVMPVVSADAHNLWWLFVAHRGEDPLFVLDAALVFGPLTYRLVAGVLVATILAVACWLTWTRRTSLAEGAALTVLGWFTFTTQAHENHLFFALPLLSLAWPVRKTLLLPFGAISVTLLLNMFLHDQLVLEGLGRDLHDPTIVSLRLANAALNVLTCVCWTALAVARRPGESVDSATVKTSWTRRPFREKVLT